MALSDKAKAAIRRAVTEEKAALELISALEAAANEQADNVAELGMTSDLSAISGTYANGVEPTGAEVDATVQGLADEVEARLDDAEGKIDEVIQALVAAGLMASS